MRVDRVVRSERLSIIKILEALDHNLTVRDNHAPEGDLGQVLMSNGPNSPPSFQDASSAVGEHTHDAADIVSGVLDPHRTGTGTPGSDKWLRGDGAWAEIDSVEWGDVLNKPTDFAGYGLDDDLATALLGFSRVGHRHYYDEIIGTPSPSAGAVTMEEVRNELTGYARIGHTHYYGALMDTPPATPPGSGLTEPEVRVLLSSYALIGHNHRIEEEALAMEFILANQIFGG